MLQDRMKIAINNYLEVALILREDLTLLYESEVESPLWRRNFIRSAIALLEGSCHCYLDLCAVALECGDVTVSKGEEMLILNRRAKRTSQRIKLAIRLVHRVFNTGSNPDFTGDEWLKAQEVIDRRHRLMHPKTSQDLDISEAQWQRNLAGIQWLQREEFRFVEFLYRIQKGTDKPAMP